MTSSHGNTHNHTNTVSHNNTWGNRGHANYGDHSVTFLGESYEDTFPLDTCESSLSILYDKSEALRNQFHWIKRKTTTGLPTKPSTIKLGSNTSGSLLYSLLANGRNDQYLPAEYRITRTYDHRNNYTMESRHTNSGHSSSDTIFYKGEVNVPSKTEDYKYRWEDMIPIGGAAYYVCDPVFLAYSSSGITSETISGSTTSGSIATKATLTSLIKIFNKYLVNTSKVNVKSYTSSETVYNTITGHSSYTDHSSDNSKREYKDNIKKYLGDALDKLNKVEVVTFNYKPEISDPTIDRVGFIADDTDEIFSTRYHDRMDFMNCIGMLIKGVQELSQEIQNMKNSLAEKEKEIEGLKSKL